MAYIINSQLFLCILSLMMALPSITLGAQNPGFIRKYSQAHLFVSESEQIEMNYIKSQIANEYSDLKSLEDVVSFLHRLRDLFQQHPKNVAFVAAETKELFKLLSQEIVVRLLRVDEEPFMDPMDDDRLSHAQKVIEEDDLVKKLFGASITRLVESRKQQLVKPETGNHKETNFFQELWCKISGNCPS